jgi:hypothetical protein
VERQVAADAGADGVVVALSIAAREHPAPQPAQKHGRSGLM